MEHLLTTTTAVPTAVGGGHRRARQAAAVMAAVALAGGLLAFSGGGDDTGRAGPTTSAPVTTSPRQEIARPAPAPAAQSTPVPAAASTSQRPSADAAPVSPVGTPATASLPTSPEDYATAAFDAWLQGDDRRLTKLTTEPVTDFLGARAPDEPGEWSGPTCDGAAGSTYCAWAQPAAQLVLRVHNEAVSQGRKHAVAEAFLIPPAGGVALWPFTTAERAANTQAAVDEGHQPWLLGAESVAGAYARGELGWQDASMEQVQVQPSTYRVTDPASGAQADLTLSQPARQGDSGIWAVVRAGSVPPR
jgi:hypothetical protein